MSDNTDSQQDDPADTSLLTNLKNKLTYKLHNVAYDPNANKFAEERAKKLKEDKEKNIQDKSNDKTTDDDNTDPNKFNFMRMIKKSGKQALSIISKGIIPFIALMLSMIVANELIVYSVPIRVIFFIFTFLICLTVPPLALLLGIFYCLKGGYSYYVNHMTDRPKQEIMPTIYALLPISTYQAASSFGSFFLYPFTYPKTEIAAEQLPKTMEQYWMDLKNSFTDLDKVKNLPLFVNDIKQIQKDLSELHNPKGGLLNFGKQQSTNTKVINSPENIPNSSQNKSKDVVTSEQKSKDVVTTQIQKSTNSENKETS
jgi:hypothetical protein